MGSSGEDAAGAASPATRAAIEEFDRFAAGHGDSAAAFERVRAAFREYVEGEASGPEIERRVQQCVTECRGASFIRLGEGEGNVLALGLNSYPALTAYCVRQTSAMHFGAPDVLLDAGPELQERFHAAICNAEVVGFPGLWVLPLMLEKSKKGSTDIRSIYGAGAVYEYLERFADELGLAGKLGSSAAFSRNLLPHYGALIEGRDIALVSCRDSLPEVLRQRMGARSVDFYPVPEQANPLNTGRSVNTGHYPNRYRALLEELRGARAGIVHFVAAGVLGKVYCEAIREAGGIALDIGAVADAWAGVRSRWNLPRETVEQWRIL